MDFSETEALKQHLLTSNPTFAQLVEEHQTYEQRLTQLASLHYPSAEEQIEESTLKKKKLYLKDQMESILRQHKQQAAGR